MIAFTKLFVAAGGVAVVVGTAIALEHGRYIEWSLPLLMNNSQPTCAVLPTTRIDLGSVASDESLQATFVVHNTGGRRLILRKKTSSCKCVASREIEIIVPPGGHGVIPLAVKTMGLSGQYCFTTCYYTNDQRCPVLGLEVAMVVEPCINGRGSEPLIPIEPIPMRSE